jgi:hypothetical protein
MTFITTQFDFPQFLVEKSTLISINLVMLLFIKKFSDVLTYFSAPEMIFIKKELLKFVSCYFSEIF